MNRFPSSIIRRWLVLVALIPAGGCEQTFAATITVGWWWFPLSLFMPAIWLAGSYVERRETTRLLLWRFGNDFIREFERPLIQEASGKPAVRSRLLVLPHQERLEILVAPQNGRRYPNLFDHRNNLDYDIERIVRLLGDHRFVSRAPAARGQWIVIPFQYRSVANKEGGA